MRLAKPATVSDFERLKPPYIGVIANSVIHLFLPFEECEAPCEIAIHGYIPLLN